jgi:seryl-tRNA synthetase
VLDLRAIREDPDPYLKALARRGAAEDLARALELDEERRRLLVQLEAHRADLKRYSKGIGRMRTPEDRADMVEASRVTSGRIRELEAQLASKQEELDALLARLPNLPDPTVPDGAGEEDNEVLRRWGEPPAFDFEPRDHVELGEALGILDLERAARTSGSRFVYLMGPAVRVQFALVQYALDFAEARGFVPVVPPVLVREEAMFGTGFLPADEAQLYVTREDDLYLIGTSEVPLASLHAGEILAPDDLPRRYLGYSTCFRREAGTYGKDTTGIFRVHQFDKLEMFSFVLPEESVAEHDRLLAHEEAWVQSLGIPYQVVNVCIGDLGAPAAKKYDIEAWMPGQGRYREITSASNTTDYQARRLEVRVRLPEGNRPVHTLNGTLCAVGRTLIALLENGQRADGSVVLPEVLHPYLPPRDHVLRPA